MFIFMRCHGPMMDSFSDRSMLGVVSFTKIPPLIESYDHMRRGVVKRNRFRAVSQGGGRVEATLQTSSAHDFLSCRPRMCGPRTRARRGRGGRAQLSRTRSNHSPCDSNPHWRFFSRHRLGIRYPPVDWITEPSRFH